MTKRRPASLASRAATKPLDGASVVGKDDLIPLDRPLSAEQLEQRARLVNAILVTRKRVQALRDRADRLSGALDAFHDRQGEIRRRA
ncbi:MAG TPA: hypothetical protein PKC03_16725 [Dokdonella sp.]|jgi:hypothetical protein|nr:hypothetical protein [Dokdonella sp.]